MLEEILPFQNTNKVCFMHRTTFHFAIMLRSKGYAHDLVTLLTDDT